MATVTMDPMSTHAKHCPCGCAPCPDEGCDLECLIRPRSSAASSSPTRTSTLS